MRSLRVAVVMVSLAAAGCRAPDPAPEAAPPAAVESVPPSPELRLRYRTGDVARYRSRAESDMQVRLGSRSAGGVSVEEVDVTHRVVAITPEGNAVIEVTIDSSALSCEVPGLGKALALDTRKPETVAAWREQCRTDPSAHILAPLVERVGGRLRITVAPDGTIADARVVKGSAKAFQGVDGSLGIPYVLQVLGSVDPLPAGAVEAGLGGPFTRTYDGPAGLHETKGKREVTAWDPATGLATLSTEAKVLFYPPLDEHGGRCSEPGCPGLPPGFRFKDWSVRAEESLDLRRGVRTRSSSIHTITAAADPPPSGGPAPTFTMEMRITVEELR